jgi:hypothetical protein
MRSMSLQCAAARPMIPFHSLTSFSQMMLTRPAIPVTVQKLGPEEISFGPERLKC